MNAITLAEPKRSVGKFEPMTIATNTPVPVKRISKGEVLLVCVLALGAFTVLLLRLPYRAPLANTLLTAIGLTSVYAYLKLRLDIGIPFGALLCLVVSVVLDIVGNQFGLFSQRIGLIPYDIITHFTASGLSFILVMWMMMRLIDRFGYRLPPGLIAFFSVTTTFSLAAYYEITELIDERLLGGQRMWNPRDTAQDLAADLTGIIIAAIVYALVVRRRARGSLESVPSHLKPAQEPATKGV